MILLKVTVIVLLLGQTIALPLSRCFRDCSGHGKCVQDTCECDIGYRYPTFRFSNQLAADCSQRLCPFDVSWADKAQQFNIAHKPSECSRNGLCNRNTGDCHCFPGYEGEACQRIVCGNAVDLKVPVCSGHGTCQTIGQAYDRFSPAKRNFRSPDYLNWDAQHTTLCDCEIGFTGPDCNLSKFTYIHKYFYMYVHK
jgi:hypothetical protein